MEEIISLIVANGLWAVLFCGLLAYELRDSRSREGKYTQTIRALSERLQTVADIKTDTTGIKADICDILSDTKKIKSDTETIKRAVSKTKKAGRKCAGAPM